MELVKQIRNALDKATRAGDAAWPIWAHEPAGVAILAAIEKLEAEEAKAATRACVEVDPPSPAGSFRCEDES